MKVQLFWRALFVALVAFVLFMSLTPDPGPAKGGATVTRWLSKMIFGTRAHADKVGHLMAYATLAGVFVQTGWKPWGRAWAGVLWLGLFGLALEGAQGLTTYRELSGFDLLANWIGLALGYPGGLIVAALLAAAGFGRPANAG